MMKTLLCLLLAATATANSYSNSVEISSPTAKALQQYVQQQHQQRQLQQRPRQTATTPLTNDSLRQAVDLWLGTDHNQAEVLSLLGPMADWDTSQVTSMNALFKGARNALADDEDLSRWNVERVTTMMDMFNGCTAYRGRPSLEAWNTSQVTSMARMFKSATNVRDMDLSMLDTSSVTDMSSMFQVSYLLCVYMGWDGMG